MRRAIAFVMISMLCSILASESLAQHGGRNSCCAPRTYCGAPRCYAPPTYCVPRCRTTVYYSYCQPCRPSTSSVQTRAKITTKSSAPTTTPKLSILNPTPRPNVPGPKKAPETPVEVMKPTPMDITSTIEARGYFRSLLQAARKAEVLVELDNPGPFTVFAPTDEAFGKLEPGLLDQLMTTPESLRNLLFYHALTQKLDLADAVKQGRVGTVLGPEVRFRKEGDRILVNEARIIGPGVECTNGLIYEIDRVLLPPASEPPEADSSAQPEAGGAPVVPPVQK